jgi:multiple sugar transport system permease protein
MLALSGNDATHDTRFAKGRHCDHGISLRSKAERRTAMTQPIAPGTAGATRLVPQKSEEKRPRRTGVTRGKNQYNKREAVAGYLFVSPWILGFLVFTAGAMIYSLVISFSRYNLATNSIRPAGVSNYQNLFDDPRVAVSLGNTLFYAIFAVPLEIVFALVLAMLLARVGRGAGIFRTLYYLPKMTPAVATAALFFLLLNGNTGAINQGLRLLGIEGPQWLIDPDWVKASIIIMSMWSVAGTMVIFLAALKNVPRDLYEVAALDGAGPIRQFFAITLPMISGAMFFNVIVLTIAAFQIFDQAYLLFWRDQSNASPEAALFYAIYLFQNAFERFDFGFASAMAWLLFVIIMAITLIQVKFGNKFVYYEGDK